MVSVNKSNQEILKGISWTAAPLRDVRSFYESCKQAGITVYNPARGLITALGLAVFRAASIANLGSEQFYWLEHQISADGTMDALFPSPQNGEGYIEAAWTAKGHRCRLNLITVLAPHRAVVPVGVVQFIPVRLVEGANGRLGVYLDLDHAISRPVAVRREKPAPQPPAVATRTVAQTTAQTTAQTAAQTTAQTTAQTATTVAAAAAGAAAGAPGD